MILGVDGKVPNPADKAEAVKRAGMEHALEYMGLAAGTPLNEIPVDVVFIGSCTNSRTEDLREAAAVAKGRKKADNVNRVLVMPGYGLVKEQAEVEGLDKILTDTGFEWREPGCSMCLVMNADRLAPQERCPPPPTAILKDGRATAAERTLSAQQWRRPGILWMYANWLDDFKLLIETAFSGSLRPR